MKQVIKLYQFLISPLLGSCCRFYPSCSEYALEAFEKRSFFVACWLVMKRLCRCGPWHPGGFD
ncbi:MAG: membrane protein insertion efficiency factor YidD, partial [Rhabdochlamydiaceae bacterium]